MVSFPQLIVQIVKELRLVDPEDGKTTINSATRRPFYRINCKRKSRWTSTPLLDLIVKHNVFVSPTLSVYERRAGEKGATVVQEQGFANMMRFAGMCHAAGAKVVVGSHTWGPFVKQGWPYQRELELLVDSGLTPLEAITAGTLDNAQFFGAEDRLGSIEPGKSADLLLVAGNPAKDIRAMYNVRHVMLNGVWMRTPPNESTTKNK